MHFNLSAISDTKKIIQNSIISPKKKINILFLGRVMRHIGMLLTRGTN